MSHHSARLFRTLAAVGGLALLALGHGRVLPSASADTLPHLSADCFTYSPGEVSRSKQGVLIKGMHAELTGTQHRITVASSTVTDHGRKLDEAALTRLNAAVAYAALTAYHRGMTDVCSTQPLPEVEEVKNALPELHWKGITMTRPDRVSTASAAHVNVLTTTPTIHVLFDASGLHSDGAILLPPALSGDVSFTPAARPPYHLTINRFHTVINGSDVDGKGTVTAGEGTKNLKADVHLSIGQIGEMIDQVSKVAPAKITAALLIARFMGEREPDHHTGWRIVVDNGTIKVNGVKVPAPF